MNRSWRIDSGIFWHSVDANPTVGRRISQFFKVSNRGVMLTFVSTRGSLRKICAKSYPRQVCAI